MGAFAAGAFLASEAAPSLPFFWDFCAFRGFWGAFWGAFWGFALSGFRVWTFAV
ncbi:MAG: hypothetical protein ABSB99_00695 [Acidimicrobiales bacterium]